MANNSKLKELFKLHNIKYAISVDDCYVPFVTEEIKSQIINLICEDFNSLASFFDEIGKRDKYNEINDFPDLEYNMQALVSALVTDDLSNDELKLLLESSGNADMIYSGDRNVIINFLENLKNDGIIIEYQTIATTNVANQFLTSEVKDIDGSILWLLDKDFAKVNESPDAGIRLAENILMDNGGLCHYIYILSSLPLEAGTAEAERAECDRILIEKCENTDNGSLISWLKKSDLLSGDMNLITQDIVYGIKRKSCYDLFDIYKKCLDKSIAAATKTLKEFSQEVLDCLLHKKVNEKGESNIELIARMINILQTDEYNKAFSNEFKNISERMNNYGKLCNDIGICEPIDEEEPQLLTKLREVELFNNHVNTQFLELSTGDIFMYKKKYYLLISQSCDTFLRKDGQRSLENATLLEIIRNDKESITNFRHDLSCFPNFDCPAAVVFRKPIHIPFDILDLCVMNPEGQACLNLDLFIEKDINHLINHSYNFNKRIVKVIKLIKLYILI